MDYGQTYGPPWPASTERALPKIGDGATLSVGSDRYPFTVIRTTPKGTVWIQQDDAVCTSGNAYNSEAQDWEMTPNPDGVIHRCSPSKKYPGRWTWSGMPVHIGHRSRHNDPSF